MGPRYYVIATLGAAPAVLSELLWILVMREDADIVGLEVWTTGGDPPPPPSGQARLNTFDDAGQWSKLWTALGDRAHRVPRPRQSVPLEAVLPAIATGQRTWCVRVFGHPTPLADVRTPEDALAMEIELHARVRHLRTHLPSDVVLLGSLAGGRKTMSAALQTAFILQSDLGDRLVHVLLHPELEALERREAAERAVAKQSEPAKEPASAAERRGNPSDSLPFSAAEAFVVPDPTLPVPVDDQVTLHEVWYPRLRRLFADAALQTGRTLLEHFEREPYGDLVRRLRQAETPARGRLERRSHTAWRYTVLHDKGETALDLTDRQGEVLAILVLNPEGLSAQDLFQRQVDQGLIEDTQDTKILENHWDRIRTNVTRLRQRLADLPLVGLADFVPTRADGPGRLYRVPAAARIELDPQSLHRDRW
jgi:CRISPR-associated protein (TIGR02584 family)